MPSSRGILSGNAGTNAPFASPVGLRILAIRIRGAYTSRWMMAVANHLDAAADEWEACEFSLRELTARKLAVDDHRDTLRIQLAASEQARQKVVTAIQAWQEKPFAMTAETLLDLILAALAQTKDSP